jgi:two-component system, chemotaxis family, chemotaxis protein CheY
MTTTPANIDRAIEGLVILVADSNAYMRRVTRMMLTNLGVRAIYEAVDGVAALDAIRTVSPDVMIMNWDMPVLDGPEVMRIVRSPDAFPKPNLPIIMLTDLGLRSRVHSAMKLGVHEFLVKPISPKTLHQRLLSILLNPRPMVRAGSYYVPLPRRRADLKDVLVAAAGEMNSVAEEMTEMFAETEADAETGGKLSTASGEIMAA